MAVERVVAVVSGNAKTADVVPLRGGAQRVRRRVTFGLTAIPAGVADQLFAATGNPSVDQRLASVAKTARAVLAALEAGACPYKPAAINRWVARHMELCAQVFHRPPPAELVQLMRVQLGVKGRKRDGERKNREKFVAAAEYRASHPDASAGTIARAIKYDQKAVIKKWLEDPEFQEIVGTKRALLLYRDKKSQEV